MLLAALLAATQPAAPPKASAQLSVSARIVRPVRVVGGRPDTPQVMQLRMRPGLALIEFQ